MSAISSSSPAPGGGTIAGGDEIRRYNRPRTIAAMITVTNPGAFSMIATPLLLTAFVSGGGVSVSQAAKLGAGELAGMTAAAFASALLVARHDRRLMVCAGLATAIAGHLLSISLHGFGLILAARCLAGFGAGTMFTTGAAALAGASNPDRVFGFSMTINQVTTLILMGILAGIGTAVGPVPIVATIALVSAAMGLAIPFVPARAPIAPPSSASPASPPRAAMLPPVLALGGILVFSVGIGAVWPLIGQIGLSRGVPGDVVDGTIVLAGFAAIAGGLCAAVIATRFGRLPVLAACMFCLFVAMLALRAEFSTGEFRLTLLAIMFFWPLSIPFYLGALAALDASGRVTALSGAALPGGMALGQGLAAALVSHEDITKVAILGAPAMLVALALIAAAARVRSHQPVPYPASSK